MVPDQGPARFMLLFPETQYATSVEINLGSGGFLRGNHQDCPAHFERLSGFPVRFSL
jgi:hypothetical protein